MGLTSKSVGINSIDRSFIYQRKSPDEKIIALAGNPNVGKSTIFNSLTGMRQHTGNWPGKTVTTAFGTYEYNNSEFTLVDLPGTYSLLSHSQEEEIARNYICFGGADAVVVVCDAVCLERNLNLVFQTLEITNKVIVVVNLLDEATKKHIHIDLKKLSKLLHVPVIGTNAHDKKSLLDLMKQIERTIHEFDDTPLRIAENISKQRKTFYVPYPSEIETCIDNLLPHLKEILPPILNERWCALQLIDCNESLISTLSEYINYPLMDDSIIIHSIEENTRRLNEAGIYESNFKDHIVSALLEKATIISKQTVHFETIDYDKRDRAIDRVLTNKRTGFPIMLLLLLTILWITIAGANIPSDLLYDALFSVEDVLFKLASAIHLPEWAQSLIINGVYRVLAWVISVMLPPMAIFFPMFTLLEDLGYLPRVAFNLDHQFQKAKACGKQALTLCMGFGCNAAGVIGCRIIDSPRERLIAILTNVFVPCNGRFPTLISLITMFFIGGLTGLFSSFASAMLLTVVITLGILVTLLVSRVLSNTLLKGVPSSFTLELPPYRKPQIRKLIVHSVLDRTLFVLGRAVAVAAPAGLVIWIMANVQIHDITLLTYCTEFLDPFGRLIGLDGVILMGFILGFPANEIVIPIIIMAYLSQSQIIELNDLTALKQLLVDNGWTWLTGLCMILFSLFHWPCSTTCITIKKETKSNKWTLLSFLIPTFIGFFVCFITATICRLIFF